MVVGYGVYHLIGEGGKEGRRVGGMFCSLGGLTGSNLMSRDEGMRRIDESVNGLVGVNCWHGGFKNLT